MKAEKITIRSSLHLFVSLHPFRVVGRSRVVTNDIRMDYFMAWV